MIIALRFIERDGKRILQYVGDEDLAIENGGVKPAWKDVPLETGETGEAG